MIIRTFPAVFCISLMISLSGCASDQIGEGTASSASETTTSGSFTQQTETLDDRLVFQYIPDSSQPADYMVTYSIFKNHKRMFLAEKELIKNISHDSPIIISVSRDKGFDYTIKMSIYTENNAEVPIFKEQRTVKGEE